MIVILIASFECSIIHAYAWEVDNTSSVTNIVDGDTFDIATGDRIRLADIDAPEPDEEGGPEAKQYLSNLILGKTVYLDIDDKYAYDYKGEGSRLVCVVFISYNTTQRLNVNEKLVRQNLAEYENYDNEFNPPWSLYWNFAPDPTPTPPPPSPTPTPPPIPTPPLPPILSDLTITPEEVELGDEVAIGLDIMNIDSQSFTYIVTVQIGELSLLVDVELDPYESKTVNRTITPDMVGDFNVTVDGLSGSFAVKAPPRPAEFEFSNLRIFYPGVIPPEVERDPDRYRYCIYRRDQCRRGDGRLHRGA